MNTNINRNEITKPKARSIEVEAFFKGSHTIPNESDLAVTRDDFKFEGAG